MCSANHGCLAVNLQQHMSLFLRAGGVRSNNVAPAHVLYVYIFSNRDKTAYTMLQCLEIPHILVLELVYCCWSESAGKAAFAACQYIGSAISTVALLTNRLGDPRGSLDHSTVSRRMR